MDKILELLGLSQLMQPKAHDNIDSLIQSNQSMPEQTIGPIPEGGLSQQDLLEMIMPFGGMGRIAKTGAKGVVRAGSKLERNISDFLKRGRDANKKLYEWNMNPEQIIRRGILKETKGMPRKGTSNETFRELAKDTRLTGPKYDAGDDFFKRTIRNLLESMEGKEI